MAAVLSGAREEEDGNPLLVAAPAERVRMAGEQDAGVAIMIGITKRAITGEIEDNDLDKASTNLDSVVG